VGVEVDLDAAGGESFGAVAGLGGAELGQQPGPGVDQHPVGGLKVGAVAAGGVAGEVFELAEGFDPGVAAADDGEGQQPASPGGVGGGRGLLETGQNVVAQRDGVVDGAEPEAVFSEPGDGGGAGDGAGCEDEDVVADAAGRAVSEGHGYPAAGVVDGEDRPGQDDPFLCYGDPFSAAADPVTAAVLRTLVAEAQRDEAVVGLLRTFTAGRRQVLVNLLQRGAERGELRSDVSPETLVDAAYGTLRRIRLRPHTFVAQGAHDLDEGVRGC